MIAFIKNLLGIGESNPLNLCSSCQSLQLKGMTLRGLINRSDFSYNDFECATVLVFHLFNQKGCNECKEKAINHLGVYVKKNRPGFDVQKYVDSLRAKNE